MCAIIGAVIRQPTEEDFSVLTKLMLESSVRGLHATGVAYINRDGALETVSRPQPAIDFLDTFNVRDCVADDGNLYFMGHCRYSTSSLDYNQPLSDGRKAVVHNGVISQEMPHRWKELYGHSCLTENDSELLLYEPEERWSVAYPNASIAALMLYSDKKVRMYRNGKRPLYYALESNAVWVSSTKDIIIRAGIAGEAQNVPPHQMLPVEDFRLPKSRLRAVAEDLQRG